MRLLRCPSATTINEGTNIDRMQNHQADLSGVTNFKPIMDMINNPMKKILQKLASSLKYNIPTSTVPTAPIPDQIA